MSPKDTPILKPFRDVNSIYDSMDWVNEINLKQLQDANAALLQMTRILDACIICKHPTTQHKRQPNGEYACTYFGCGCRGT